MGLAYWEGFGDNTCERLRETGWAEGEVDCDVADVSANLWEALKLDGSSEISSSIQGDQAFVTSHWCWMCTLPGEGVALWMRAILGKGLRCELSAANTPGSWRMSSTK